ncbi:hypothetical protein [Paraburkholderia sp. J12]|uniref:hypothetical protein n=1 Tax=Paraburkholderia sp. J12 TaxID=2805432 RepID=UPI002ABDB0DD|nr:hypothetical protein [Paraburkholderia sp. J12]
MKTLLPALFAASVLALPAVSFAQSNTVAPGDDAAQAVAHYGAPAETYALPDGGKRLLWPTQPFGSTTRAVDVAADGKVQRVSQVLQPAEFNQAQVGAWTQKDVLAHFGRPAESTWYPLAHREVWSYRYVEGGVWHEMYNFYFDRGGVLRLTQKSPDLLNGDSVD